MADRLLMVYDMRVMRAMAPIQVRVDPTFLRFVPALSHHLVVVSQVSVSRARFVPHLVQVTPV